MFISLLRLLSSFVLFLLVLFIFLKAKQKETDKKKLMVIDNSFAICLALVGVYSCRFGYLFINNKTYSMLFIVALVAGLIFDVKRTAVVVVIELFCLLLQPDFADMRDMLNVDILAVFFSALEGILCRAIIYKNMWPSVLGSIMMSMILTIVYMIFTTLSLAFVARSDTYNIANETLIIKTIQNTSTIVLTFLFLNVAFKKYDESVQNGLLYKFLKKYNILLLIAIIVLSLFSFGFYYLYVINQSISTVKINYNMAKYVDVELKDEYGENYFDDSEYARYLCENWIVGEGGAMFVLDEDGEHKNVIAKEIQEYYSYDKVLPERITDLKAYPEDKIFNYEFQNGRLLAIYFTSGKYKMFCFMPYRFMFNRAYYAAFVTSCAITLIAVAMFILSYVLFKNLILNKIVAANKKLKMISDGNYDIVLEKTSTTEISELSLSINKTVDTLKANIKEIEERNRQELDLARKIQSAQLSTPDDYTPAGLLYADNIPAEEVGGDFYDMVSIDAKRKAFIIADVSGKGIPAAMFMMKAKHTIMNYIKQKLEIDKVMEYTNETLCKNNDALMFVTCFVIFVDLETGMAKYVNAGHNQPIICIKENGEYKYQYTDTKPNMMLGIQANATYDVHSVRFGIDDTVFMYTDGITEARNKDKEFFGEERLLKAVSSIKHIVPKALCEKIVDDVEKFSYGAKQHDDMTLLCFKYNGPNNTIIMDATEKDFEKGKILMRRFFDLYDIDKQLSNNLKVVYDEIYSNIMKHAYGNKGGELIYELNMKDKTTIEMVFKDRGPEFNPIAFDNDDKNRKAEDKINGGMGIMFCKNIMDKCEYERKDGFNVLKLYKNAP